MSKVIIGLSVMTVEDIPSYMGETTHEKVTAICNTMANDFDAIESATFKLGQSNSAEITAHGDYEEIIEALDDYKSSGVLSDYIIKSDGRSAAA